MIVGLTGGIGSGKSAVAKEFKKLGIGVVDADQVARDVVEPGTDALKQIAAQFGSKILTGDALDRRALREVVFNDAEKLDWLNNLLHPIIRGEIFKQLSLCKSAYSILEAPLLFENNLDQQCDKSIVVDLPVSRQIERAVKRDNSNRAGIEKIIDKQMPREERLAKADFIIDNSGLLNQLKNQVSTIHQELCQIVKSLNSN